MNWADYVGLQGPSGQMNIMASNPVVPWLQQQQHHLRQFKHAKSRADNNGQMQLHW